MKAINYIVHYVLKFGKGIFAIFVINIILFTGVVVINSCKKMGNDNSSVKTSSKEFIQALRLNIKQVGATTFKHRENNNSAPISTKSGPEGQTAEYETVYLEFPTDLVDETNYMLENASTIQDLSNLISYTDARIQYEPSETNLEYQIDIPIQEVSNSFNPLISEAKNYLYGKGFTEQDIQDMIISEGGTEQDLIPFVMSLSHIEDTQNVAYNSSNFFSNSAYAMNEYVRCAMVAIGADIIMNLGGSMASTWTIATMKRAFGAVAKRALGPIGVAIAVVSFALCIND